MIIRAMVSRRGKQFAFDFYRLLFVKLLKLYIGKYLEVFNAR